MNSNCQSPAYSSPKKNQSLTATIRSEKRLSGLRLLLVDDSPHNQLLMGKLLRLAGAEVALADNGRNAIEIALGGEFHAILMDVQMPDINGYQATAQLRRMGYRKPIIALTAHVLNEDRDRCLQMGFTDHFGKPIDLHKMVQCLQAYLGESSSP